MSLCRVVNSAVYRTPGRQRFAWPADREAIVAETIAAGRDRLVPVLVAAGGSQ